jgi:flagellar motor switch protein FliN/FliY
MNMMNPAAVPPLENFRAGAPGAAGAETASLAALQDLQVTLAMEVGRTTITVRELLQLTAGSVLELQRSTSEAFDVLVNGTLLAHGEPVVVNDRCGVRLTEVVRPNERRQFPGQ